MRACKVFIKRAGLFQLLLLTLLPLLASLAPFEVPVFGSVQVAADAAPITPQDVATGSCPSGTSFTKGDSTHPPSCYRDNPAKQADCPAGSHIKAVTGGLGPSTASCVSAGDAPTKAQDCPKGFTYSANGPSTHICQYSGPGTGSTAPKSPADCEKLFPGKGYKFINGPASVGQCIPPTTDPTSQKDCTPSGTIFTPGTSGLGAAQASCTEPSAAAQSNCKGKTGSDNIACVTGFDTQDCSSFSDPNLKKECEDAKAAANAGTDNKTLSCDGSLTSSLSWFLCPIIDMMSSLVNTIDGWITDQLCVNSSQIFGASNDCSQNGQATASDQQTSNAYYNAWSSFRNIALGLMVIAGLVVLIAHALGMEILDAYTIRKSLPRLLLVAIGITLSWPLMNLMVNISNDLGLGIRHLIYAPFSGFNNQVGLGFGGGLDGGIENFVTGLIGSAVTLGLTIMMLPVLLSLLGTASLAVFIAILVLLLRQVAIILLILVAPIAIVAYILPNTQNIYKLWWESFSKALMMFPLIAGFIAAGRVFSAVSLANPDILHQIIGFGAYFAPYFLIPATFKLAGGAIRQLGGFVNDRSRGAFDRLRNQRARQMKQIGQDIQSGNAARWLGSARPDSLLGRSRRRLAQASNVGSAGIRPSQWKNRINDAVSQYDALGTSKELLNHAALTKLRGNDALGEALMRNDFNIDKTRAELREQFGDESANQMISAYQNANATLRKAGHSERAIQTAAYLSGLSATTAHTNKKYDYADMLDENGNVVRDENGNAVREHIGAANVAANLARLSGGDANVAAQMYAAAMEATGERPDLAPSFSEGAKAMGNIENASAYGAVARQETIRQTAKELRRTAIRKKGLRVLFGSGHTARHLAPEYEAMLNETYEKAAPLMAAYDQALQDQATGGVRPLTQQEAAAKDAKVEATRSAMENSPEFDRYMQMVAETVAAQKNSANLPLEIRPIVGNLVEHELGPGVTAQSEGYRLRMHPKFQKYVEDFQFAYGSRGGTAAAAAAAAPPPPGGPGGPPPPGGTPPGRPF